MTFLTVMLRGIDRKQSQVNLNLNLYTLERRQGSISLNGESIQENIEDVMERRDKDEDVNKQVCSWQQWQAAAGRQ